MGSDTGAATIAPVARKATGRDLAKALAAATLCVRRLERSLRARCPKRLWPAICPEAVDLAVVVSGGGIPSASIKTRGVADALMIATLGRNELAIEGWVLRRDLAAQTDRLLRDLGDWMTAIDPVVQFHIERNARLGDVSRNFPAHEIPLLAVEVGSVLGSLTQIVSVIDQQFLYPDRRRAGRPAIRLLLDVTRALCAAGFSARAIANLTDDTSDRHVMERVRGRIRSLGHVERIRHIITPSVQIVPLPVPVVDAGKPV